MPELVEKKDPPIMIKIKKINDKFLGILVENPILEIELQMAKKSDEKLSSILRKRKKKLIKIIR